MCVTLIFLVIKVKGEKLEWNFGFLVIKVELVDFFVRDCEFGMVM